MSVISHPNPALKQRACEVDPTSDDTLVRLAKSMARSMYAAPGIGLAATQVGVLKRVIIYDLDDEGEGLVVLCNPRIISTCEEITTEEEGCLSLPGVAVPVPRAETLVCEAEALDGHTLSFEASGLHARLIQHEIDHLDGVLIIDRASPEDRREALRGYREILEQSCESGSRT